MNQIHITACDNEMFLVASGTNSSAPICHIQSVNGFTVMVTINIKKGSAYSPITEINGLTGPINKTIDFIVPEETVYITPMCLNWSGPYDFKVKINNKDYNKKGNSSIPLGLVLGDIVEDGGTGIEIKL
ncbi:hypothetical protein [Sulfurimonas sp. CS5]|jgi:hypothetical protein|uniref:hypothetical protein n=1 Tax=Sulfurimonas sp. CS5 TaxID=3391145 RepID=UPI0039EC9CAE